MKLDPIAWSFRPGASGLAAAASGELDEDFTREERKGIGGVEPSSWPLLGMIS